jgi:hypothetical protein
MKGDDILDLLYAWHDNSELSPGRRDELLSRLQADSRLRQELADHVCLAALVRVVQAPEARWLRLEDYFQIRGQSPGTVEDRVMGAIGRPAVHRRPRIAAGGRFGRGRRWSAILAVLTLTVVGLGLSKFGRHMPVTDRVEDGQHNVAANNFLATITRARFPLVGVGEPPLYVGKKIEPKRLKILGGAVEVTIRNGTSLILEGPAEVELIDDLKAVLHFGSLVVRMPEGMSGFRVQTPAAAVLDLGTEFAVRVTPDMETDVQVYDGAVVATGYDGMPNQRLPHRLEVGQAARFFPTASSGVETIPYVENRFVRRFELDSLSDQKNEIPGTSGDRGNLRRLFGAPRHEEMVVTRCQSPVVIDADLGEWPGVAGFASSLDGTVDCLESVRGWMMYDNECLYIGAVVRDPAPLRNVFDPKYDAFAAWRGGGLQVRFSADRQNGWPVVANGPVFYVDKPGVVPSEVARAAASNKKLSHMTLWFHAPTNTPCFAIARGMYVDDLEVNPPGFRAKYRCHPDECGYTLEYAIPWDLLNCDTDAPKPGDTLAGAWQVHFSDASGRLWRDQIVELRNKSVDPYSYIWAQASNWGRLRFQDE